MFPTLSYLEWITGRPEEAHHDLGSSDLRPVPHTDGVVPEALATLPDPVDTTLEAQLAAAYGVPESSVLVTAGATHANFLAAAAAVDADESEPSRVLVEKPGYEPLVATPAGLGTQVDRFTRLRDADCELDPDRVDAAMSEGTELVTVTNRHNPTGRIVDRETLAETARVAADHGASLLVDEVYASFFAEPADGPLDGVTAAGLPNTVVTNSLTKFYGLGGVRIGWLVADEAFVDRARRVAWHVPAVSEPSRALARRALANRDVLADRSRSLLAANHDRLAGFLDGRDDLDGAVESGCTFAFPAHERADGDEVAEAAWNEGVLVVPGRFFDDRDRFRVSLGCDPERAQEGLAAFGDVLDML